MSIFDYIYNYFKDIKDQSFFMRNDDTWFSEDDMEDIIHNEVNNMSNVELLKLLDSVFLLKAKEETK